MNLRCLDGKRMSFVRVEDVDLMPGCWVFSLELLVEMMVGFTLVKYSGSTGT